MAGAGTSPTGAATADVTGVTATLAAPASMALAQLVIYFGEEWLFATH